MMDTALKEIGGEGETRQHRRFRVSKGTFVIVSPGTDNEWKVQAIDISRGGLAFVYHGGKEDLDAAGVLKILAGNVDIENFNFETVFDEPTPGVMDASLSPRRRGVKFTWMGIMGKKDLSDFVNSLSVSGPNP
jgi:hypothetical protein